METLRDTLLDTFFPDKDASMQPAAMHTDDCDPEMGCDENCTTPLPPSTHCVMCGSKIEVMSFMGTKVCSTKCDKAARGETPDGWIETRAGRIGMQTGKKIRFDLVDPFLHVEGVLAEVKESELSTVYVKIVLKDATGQSAAVRYGGTVRRAEKNIASSYNLPLDHRIDFKP